jgi:hypothetical protein
LAKMALVLGITLALSATLGRSWGLGWLLLPLSAAAYVHLRWRPCTASTAGRESHGTSTCPSLPSAGVVLRKEPAPEP